MDGAVWAKVRVPAAKTEDFLAHCGIARFRTGGADLLGPDNGAWDPDQAKSLRSGRLELPSGRGLIVAVDDMKSQGLIVYAMNYGT